MKRVKSLCVIAEVLLVGLVVGLVGVPRSASAMGIVVSTKQGIDKCAAATVSQMQTWWSSSPYWSTNVYIGGSSRGCAQANLSSSWVSSLNTQGWDFIPTWVGPQAPCTTFGSRLSSDPATANSQGRAEADKAITAATSFGLGSPSMLYYDMEAYNTGNASCRAAVKSFINGWTTRLAERGQRSGVYGSGCSTAMSDFASISKPPDDVWLAHWIYSTYTSTASVFGVSCVSDGYWSGQQRIRQYTGGHNETYGGITFNIDSDASNGQVQGNYPRTPEYSPIQQPDRVSGSELHMLSASEGWTIAGGKLRWTSDAGQTWRDIDTGLSGMLTTGLFLDSQHGWLALVSPPGFDGSADLQLASTTDGGQTWKATTVHNFRLDDGDVLDSPMNIDFINAQTGWVAVRLATSSNFSRGMLFRTGDGGLTWQEGTLPIGATVHFLDANTGFTAGGAGGNELYRTFDRGDTWERLDLAGLGSDATQVFYALPTFTSAQDGIIPVTMTGSGGASVVFFATHDRGLSWGLVGEVPVAKEPGASLPVAIVSATSWIIANTVTDEVHLVSNTGKTPSVTTLITWPAGIVAMGFTSPSMGWVRTETVSCSGFKQCESSSALLTTANGGQSWTKINP